MQAGHRTGVSLSDRLSDAIVLLGADTSNEGTEDGDQRLVHHFEDGGREVASDAVVTQGGGESRDRKVGIKRLAAKGTSLEHGGGGFALRNMVRVYREIVTVQRSHCAS